MGRWNWRRSEPPAAGGREICGRGPYHRGLLIAGCAGVMRGVTVGPM